MKGAQPNFFVRPQQDITKILTTEKLYAMSLQEVVALVSKQTSDAVVNGDECGLGCDICPLRAWKSPGISQTSCLDVRIYLKLQRCFAPEMSSLVHMQAIEQPIALHR